MLKFRDGSCDRPGNGGGVPARQFVTTIWSVGEILWLNHHGDTLVELHPLKNHNIARRQEATISLMRMFTLSGFIRVER